MENKYLALIVDVFENLEQTDGKTIEQKKRQFRDLLLRQFEKEADPFISEKYFLESCTIEVQNFRMNVIPLINEEKDMKFISYIAKKGLNSIEQNPNLMKLKREEIGKSYGIHSSVNITRFVRKAKKEMCINDIDFILESINFIEPQQPELFDFPKSTAVKKIIYLNELGVIESLRRDPQFKTNPTLLARFLHLVTGEGVSTLQPILSRLIQNSTENKNHPYYTEKTVKEARQALINSKIEIKTS